MKPMVLKPIKFPFKCDDIKGALRKQGYKNWWENITKIDTNKRARAINKIQINKEINL